MNECCNVCAGPLEGPVYTSPQARSITTMNTFVDGQTRVHFCPTCGHLQTSALFDLDKYYDSDYAIDAGSDEEDRVYEVKDGVVTYVSTYQARIVAKKLQLKAGDKVLDYGCGKALTLLRLLETQPTIAPYLFDVTDRFRPFWESFPIRPQISAGKPDSSWYGTLDAVLSFYALEHIATLHAVLQDIRRLLVDDGVLYFLIPNIYQNNGDLIVADHVNHFSETSIRHALARAGFDAVEIDDKTHAGVYIVTAHKAAEPVALPHPQSLAALREEVNAMAAYWQSVTHTISAFEEKIPGDARVAIYGAGFRATFIASALARFDRVECFIDQNRHLHGTSVLERSVLAPEALPNEVSHIFVGLHPRIARDAIASISAWHQRELVFLYL